MATFTVVLDTCVFFSVPLRDLLLQLAEAGIFRARWTEQIHEEWISNLLIIRPDLTREKFDRTRLAMNRAVPDSLVTGYESYNGTAILLPFHVFQGTWRACCS